MKNDTLRQFGKFYLLIFVLTTTACSQAPAVNQDKQTAFLPENYLAAPQEVSSLLSDQDFAQDLQIIDVRTLPEFQASCLTGAKIIDVEASDFEEKIKLLDKAANYLVYCRSGRRSADAVSRMRKAGFTNIVEMNGGITGWQAANLPVATNCV